MAMFNSYVKLPEGKCFKSKLQFWPRYSSTTLEGELEQGGVEDMVPVEDEKKNGESVNPIYKWLIFHGYVK
jgi:hypothetical protein